MSLKEGDLFLPDFIIVKMINLKEFLIFPRWDSSLEDFLSLSLLLVFSHFKKTQYLSSAFKNFIPNPKHAIF